MLAIHRAVYLKSLLSGAPFLLHTAACNSADRNEDMLPFSPFIGGGREGGWQHLAATSICVTSIHSKIQEYYVTVRRDAV